MADGYGLAVILVSGTVLLAATLLWLVGRMRQQSFAAVVLGGLLLMAAGLFQVTTAGALVATLLALTASAALYLDALAVQGQGRRRK